MTKKWMFVPLLVLALLGGLGALQLLRGDQAEFGRSDGRPAPERAFPALEGDEALVFNPNAQGERVMVNLFASWCAPCRVEHPLLMELSRRHPERLIGVLYEDSAANGAAFLSELGDPFAEVGLDPDGQGGLDFGLTGVPESFVIDENGQIILHIRGPLDRDSFAQIDRLLSGR